MLLNEKRQAILTLKTERLVLRQLSEADAEDMFEYASDPKVTEYLSWPYHRSIDDTRKFLSLVEENYQEGEFYEWGIVLKATNKLIGTCGYTRLYPNHHRGEIGYALSRKYWGQGIMTEAAAAVVSYGFNQLGLNRIEAHCRVANIGSAKVLEKLGMKYEGTLRQYFRIKGEYHDLKLYAILKEDWLEMSGVTGSSDSCCKEAGRTFTDLRRQKTEDEAD